MTILNTGDKKMNKEYLTTQVYIAAKYIACLIRQANSENREMSIREHQNLSYFQNRLYRFSLYLKINA